MKYFEKRKAVALFDTSIGSRNLGDEIIMDAVRSQCAELLPNHFFASVPTHEIIGTRSYRFAKQSMVSIVGGTNLLTSNMFGDRGWRIRFRDTLFVESLVLLGVGWRNYQTKPNWFAKMMLSRLLSREYIHSVRDTYTKEMLNQCGFDNVVNTSCVTLWRITPELTSTIPTTKGDAVVTAINTTKRHPVDAKIAKILSDSYRTVYVWIQGFDDLGYAKELFGDRAIFVAPNLKSYDQLLADPSISLDFLGTRLHAGVRAIQNRRRTIIIAIDNRAAEISKDVGLITMNRDDIENNLRSKIESDFSTAISLPHSAIDTWKRQFAQMT